MYDEVTADCNFSLYIEEILKLNEPDNIKKLLMDIFSHPLITGNNEYFLFLSNTIIPGYYMWSISALCKALYIVWNR